MQANTLKLNPDNMEVLLVGRRSDPGLKVSPILDLVVLPLKEQACSLGGLLDPGLLVGK